MASHIAANIARKRSHPSIYAVEILDFRFEPDVVDCLNNGFCTRISFIRRIAQNDDAGRIIAVRGNVRLNQRLCSLCLLIFRNGRLVEVAVILLAACEFTHHVCQTLEFGFPFLLFLADFIQGIQFPKTIVARDPPIREILQIQVIEYPKDGVIHIPDDRDNAHMFTAQAGFQSTGKRGIAKELIQQHWMFRKL